MRRWKSGPPFDRDVDVGGVVRGEVGEAVGECRVVDPGAVDGDGDLGVVVAEAAEDGLELALVVAGAADEGEGTGGCGLAQGDEGGRAGEGRVDGLVAGFGYVDGVGLRIGGIGRGGEQQAEQQDAGACAHVRGSRGPAPGGVWGGAPF